MELETVSKKLIDILKNVFPNEDTLKSFLINCYFSKIVNTPHAPHTIVRNVEGVSGLHIIYDAFNEETEKRYFSQPDLWPPAEISGGGSSRSGTVVSLYQFPKELFEIFETIQNSTFINPEQFIIPDYCLCLSYPIGSTFSGHFDSRFRWGLYIIGVNLGAPCVLTMSFPKDPSKTKKIVLPRRSIYVFSGDSRYLYKHAISKINTLSTKDAEPANKFWNSTGIRRSFTLRSTKVYETVFLEKRLKLTGPGVVINKMISENKLYKPRGDYAETRSLNSEEIAKERQMAEFQLSRLKMDINKQTPFKTKTQTPLEASSKKVEV